MSEAQTIFIPGPMPGLNEIISAKALRFGRGGMSGYTKMKSQWCGTIKLLAQHLKLAHIESGYFFYLFHEPSKSRDPSNFVSGGIKLIEDGLQDAGVLDNDGWKQVLGFGAAWVHDDKRPGCTLFVHPTRLLTKDEAIALEESWRR